MFKSLAKASRTDQIVRAVKTAILSGSYKTGDRLPPERELAGQFGVSRTSIREAVKILSTYGLIRPVQGDGLYVTDSFTENMFEFLGYGSHITAGNYRDLFQARLVMETGSLTATMADITGQDIAALEECIAATAGETDILKLQAIDARFHITLVQFSRNPILTGMYSMLHKIMANGIDRKVSVYPTAKGMVLAGHRKIVRALRSRSRARAHNAVAEHLTASAELFRRIFEGAGEK